LTFIAMKFSICSICLDALSPASAIWMLLPSASASFLTSVVSQPKNGLDVSGTL